MGRRPGRGNLPIELSSLVGRIEEVAEIRRLLGQTRLVTLTGPGGVGKTRLGRRVAELAQPQLPDGAWLVELGSLTDGGFVAETVAGTLGVPEQSGREPVEALATYLADRELLLVVDNCEHLIEACAPLIEALLSRANGLRVLATSRERLGVPGETVFPVLPLSLAGAESSPGTASRASLARDLLVERAEEASADLHLTEQNLALLDEICGALDGLPLAIELAAARLRSLSPQQLADRLQDRFRVLRGARPLAPRKQTLEGTVEWSYELCTKQERKVWTRLSVFAGSFELDAAESVCAGFGLAPGEVSDAVFGLVDKSVLVARETGGRTRFSMLMTLREFGRLRLRQDFGDGLVESPGEEAVAERHVAWYADLAARFEREWFGPDQPEWMARMRAELPNLRAALHFCVTHPEHVRTGQRLAADLCQFWNAGPKREGVAWLTQLVVAGPEPSRELVHALSALSWVSSNWLPEESLRYSQQARELADEHAPEHLPRVLNNHGVNLCTHGDPSALALLEEAVARARTEVGAASGEAAYALYGLGFALALSGDIERSDDAFAEAVEICRASGERWWQAWVRTTQAFLGWIRGDADLLAEVGIAVLPDARELRDEHLASTALGQVALTSVGRDDQRAAYLLGTCERFWEDAGGSVNRHEPMLSALARAKEALQESLGLHVYAAEHGRGAQDSLDTAISAVLGERGATTAPPASSAARAPTGFDGLTPRENEIAELVAQGLSNREVAARLVLSTRTVETHIQNIFTKTGFTSRVQLASRFAPRRDPGGST